MITGELPDTDHVARFCKPSQISDGALQATAFLLRKERKEEDLSVDWLEHFHPSNRDSQLEQLRKVFRNKFSVPATAKFAVLNVGMIKQTVADGYPDCTPLSVRHTGQADDPAHVGIFGLVGNDEIVAELLLECVIPPLVPAREP